MAFSVIKFPQFKEHAVTFSFDDGSIYDKILVPMLAKYNLKATFNVCSGLFDKKDGILSSEDAKILYNSPLIEVASHGLNHEMLDLAPNSEEIFGQVMTDRENLENLFPFSIVKGFAYPYGTEENGVRDFSKVLQGCGVSYARTAKDEVNEQKKYLAPENWYYWRPTVHYLDSAALQCFESMMQDKKKKIFYCWGHSAELFEDWGKMKTFSSEERLERAESLFNEVSGKENVWYATNIEICNYVKSFYRLQFNASSTAVYNPSATDIYMKYNNKDYLIPAGKTVELSK